VLRVAVNAGNSTGSAGLDTNLAPSMTLGTGFAGRSSIGENLEPRHLVNWTRVAYNSDPGVPFGDFTGIAPWRRPAGKVPAYPRASNLPPEDSDGAQAGPDRPREADSVSLSTQPGLPDSVRDQLRALIIEELSQLMDR
jgi:hypothetical protein